MFYNRNVKLKNHLVPFRFVKYIKNHWTRIFLYVVIFKTDWSPLHTNHEFLHSSMAGAVAIEKKYTNLIGQFFVLKNREILIDCCGGVCADPTTSCVGRCFVCCGVLLLYFCCVFGGALTLSVINWGCDLFSPCFVVFLRVCWWFHDGFLLSFILRYPWLWDFAVYLSCFVSLFFCLFLSFDSLVWFVALFC